jgi:hypothetical protein
MHPAAVRVLAVSACWAWFAAPARSQKVKTQKWEDFYPEQRHKSHQSSTPNEVNDKFRATSSPYQRVPVDNRKPQDLPPCVAPRPVFVPAVQGGGGSDSLWPQIVFPSSGPVAAGTSGRPRRRSASRCFSPAIPSTRGTRFLSSSLHSPVAGLFGHTPHAATMRFF